MLALYGEGWRRALDNVARLGGPHAITRLAEDPLVGHLLIVHGLHPQQQAMARAPRSASPQLIQIELRRPTAVP